MTVQNTNTKNIYVGNDVTTVFPYTFQIAKVHTSYIHVYIETNGIAEETDNFTLDADLQTITYPKTGSALSSNQKITISREVPLMQMLNLVNQGPYFAEDIEVALDEAVMICQQLKERLDRTFFVPVSTDTENLDLALPVAPNKSFAFNETGTALVLTDNPADVLPIVDDKMLELEQYIQQSSIEIQELVASLNSTTLEALTALRDECQQYAYEAEQSALSNVRWPVSGTRERPAWKPDYGIDNADLFIQSTNVVKIDVEE